MKYHIVAVGEILTPEARSQCKEIMKGIKKGLLYISIFAVLASFVYCVEAFILSVVTLFILNPNKNTLFDRFGNRIPRFQSNHDMQLLDLLSR